MKELVVTLDDIVPEPVKIKLKEDLTIGEDLDRELKFASAQFGYYAYLAERAETKLKYRKMVFDMWRAEEEEHLIRVNGGPFKLAKDLERKIMNHPKYKANRRRMVEGEEQLGILKAVAKAFELKASLIQTANANRRREYETSR